MISGAAGGPCRIVPVLDLLGGQVVHAQRGERNRYRPIVSPLAAGSEPVALGAALLATSAGRTLYVADLDAIQQRGLQAGALAALLAGLPGVTIWLDAGFTGAAGAADLRRRLGSDGARVRPVYGSESLHSIDALAAIASDPQAILSLDVRGGKSLDPAGCAARPDLWPSTLIVMTLDRVGAGEGPDLAHFRALRAQRPEAVWIGAGGIRNETDLDAARLAGAEAWLIASALHMGAIGRREPHAEG